MLESAQNKINEVQETYQKLIEERQKSKKD